MEKCPTEHLSEVAGTHRLKELAVLRTARKVAVGAVVDDSTVSAIASACGVEEESVSDFLVSYPGLGEESRGAGICTDLVCHLRGATRFRARLRENPDCLGPGFEGISPVSCLGLCFQAPVLRDREGNFHRLDPGPQS